MRSKICGKSSAGDTAAGVLNINHYLIAYVACANRHAATLRGVFEGVGQQVLQHAYHLIAIQFRLG